MNIYLILSAVSVFLSMFYAFRWNRRYSIFLTLMFILFPVSCLGYAILSVSQSLPMALLGNSVTYVGGFFGLLIITFNILDLCKWNLQKKWYNLMFCVNALLYIFVLPISKLHFFYKTVTFNPVGIGTERLIKEYGIVHTVYYVMIAFYFMLSIIAIIQGLKNRYAVSRKTVSLLIALMGTSILAYILKHIFTFGDAFIPSSYVLAQFFFLLIADRMVLYAVDDAVIDVYAKRGEIATFSFDKKRNYLGGNDVAKAFFPELRNIKIDNPVSSKNGVLENIDSWIDAIIESEEIVVLFYEAGGRIYRVSGDEIMDGKRVRGFNFMIIDDTDEQKYLSLIKDYNKTLEADVKKKTEEIVHINDIFGRNVSPQVRDYLLKGNVSLGGEKKDVTVMFCDIRGFTTLSENMESERIVKLLNAYFTGLEKCISAHNGVINKYIGDAVMAIFGAPMPSPTHQLDAYMAALEMRKALKKMNVQFEKYGYPQLRFGIGLHTGSVLAGTIGAASRMEYTVIGDTVNTASRIEGLCKTYSKDLLISESTANGIMQCVKSIRLNLVDCAEIRGRKQKVKLFSD